MATILYFGPARERTGLDSQELRLEGTLTQKEFWERLLAEHPSLVSLRDSCRLAVDQEYAGIDRSVDDRSEIAIIPPVAGG
jgi:molybdopterin converting factor subunit 1